MRVGPRTFLSFSHIVSVRVTHTSPVSPTLHYCYFYFTRFVSLVLFVVPRRTHVCPSHTLLYPLRVLVAGRISTTASAPTERILVMFGSQRTSLRHRCLIQTYGVTLRCFSTFKVLYCCLAYFLTCTLCLIYVLGMAVVKNI